MNLNKLLAALRQRTNAPARNQPAGRHERYTHALEQFLDGQPAVRLSGVYTLASLIDEWLTDASLPEQVRREEAQTIIDALTGCIRTPYPFAQKRQVLESDEAPEEYQGDFTHDQEALREEQLVRRTVFMEFSRRLAAASPQSPRTTRLATRKATTRCRQYHPHGLICASILAEHPSSTRYSSCTFRTPTSPPQPSTDRRISPAQPSTVTPAFPQHSSRLTHPSRARTSPTGWGSVPHTSRARQSSAGHALQTRQLRDRNLHRRG